MINILLIDDDQLDFELSKRNLIRISKDLNITWADSTAAAIKKCKKERFDCIICDYQMPDMDGMQYLKILREEGNDIPFIFLTGQGNEQVAAEAFRTGADDYQTKEAGVAHNVRLLNSVMKAIESRKERERKHEAEMKLRESEERYRKLVELSPDAIYMHRYGRILFANRAMLELLGATHYDQVVGQYAMDFSFPENHTVLTKRKNQLHAEGTILPPFQLKIKRLDGRIIDVEAVSVSFMHNDEMIIQTIARDITEQKKSQKIREAVQQISTAAVTCDKTAELFTSIHATLDALMPARNLCIALVNAETMEISYPYFEDKFAEAPSPHKPGRGLVEYVLETGKPLLATPEVLTEMIDQGAIELSGEKPLYWLGVPLRIQGRIIGVLAVITYTNNIKYSEEDLRILDFVSTQIALITERKLAQDELARSHDKYKALFENNPIETIAVDLDGRITDFNKALEHQAGKPPKVGEVMFRDYAGKYEIDMYPEMIKCIKRKTAKSFPTLKYDKSTISITISPFSKGAIITSVDVTNHNNE